MDPVSMRPVGQVWTCYPDKFGVPRQSGLAPAAWGRLVFEPEFRRSEAVRGIEGFSHLWIVFLFDRVREEEARLAVRPPRLGGNEKVGVFATRSPFRPNRIGLSACRFEGIDVDCPDAPVLKLSGVDLVDGTRVLDVKPYVPYADAIAGATGGFVTGAPEERTVEVAVEAQAEFETLDPGLQELIRQTLRWDHRPAYHEQDRSYYVRIENLDVACQVRGPVCLVVGIRRVGGAR